MKNWPANGRIPYALIAVLLMLFSGFTQAEEPPDTPDLIRITVDHSDNGILVQWEASTDTTVDLYRMYEMNRGTGKPIFTFSSETLEYKILDHGLENLSYSVTAIDTLDGTVAYNESPLGDNAHKAVSISVEFDPCVPANKITWTGYEGWEGKISGYRIFGGVAGEEPQLLKFVHEKTRSYIHGGVILDTTYNYYIETVPTTGLTSLSPIGSIHTDHPDSPEFLSLDYVSVLDRTHVELQFTADIQGPVNSYRVLRRSGSDTPFTEIGTFWNSLQSTQVVQDNIPTLENSYAYMVQSIYQPEGCAVPLVISESNPGSTILLNGDLEDQIAILTWNPYETYTTGLSGYIIQRRSGYGEFIDVQSVGPEINTWRESIVSVINGFQPGQLQYKVLAVSNQVEGGIPGISESNTVEVAVETHLEVPSAFTPGSNDMNFEFKPIIDFAPREYVLIVFDRGGRKVFETTDPGEGWDGTYSGGYVMEGVYVYYIHYTDFTGISRSISGNVTVIFP